MPQYPVPQFIESEGKITALLTYRQFFIMVGAGAICFALFFFTPFMVFLIGSFFSLSIFAIIAFYKVNNMSIITVILQAIGFFIGKKSYTWSKKEATYPMDVTQKPEAKEAPKTPPMHVQARPSKLKNIQTLVDTKK